VFLAIGGALLAFLPLGPPFTLPPELALALFVAPVLLDAAYDASLRDLKDNWVPVVSLAIGTLIIHGLTLKPVLRRLELYDDDPIEREIRVARERALRVALASFADEDSPVANVVRDELTAHLAHERVAPDGHSEQEELHRRALDAARKEVLTMRANQEIGDDAFHQLEEELDWLEMSGRHPSVVNP
jgi:NhaP-type Na+/H+ or K+/H+ antiporter